jgi:nucleotide-binding universal stress UspA family protein
LPTASRLAAKLDADLHLFSAVDTVDDQPLRLAWLRSVTVSRRPGDCEVVVNRDPAGAIHERLQRLPGSIAYMASHAHVRRAALTRSVLTELLARAHDPVIAVGPMIGDFAPWLEHEPQGGVLVGVDDDGEAVPLADLGTQWAMQLDERLTVLTVAEPLPPPLVTGPVRRRYGPDGDVDHFLRVLLARIHGADAGIEPRVIYDPVGPADGIVSWVREHSAVLVVVGTAAPTGVKRFVTGSTAAAIVRGCPTPVLVVPTRVRHREGAGRQAVRTARARV